MATVTSETADSPEPGATMATEYLGQRQQLTLVSMDDLKEFQSSMGDEFRQFSLGGFLMSGALWMGAERLFTDDAPFKDVFFWFCFFAALAGAVVAYFAYRQLNRRNTKIQGIMDRAQAQRLRLATKDSTTAGAAAR